MRNSQSFFPEDLYPYSLSIIHNIPFTRREIDVIACLVSARKTSKIAYFLSIDPRTVETHIRNITLKLECNTREGIIDFLETSDKLPILRQHYTYLQTKAVFEKGLKNIAKLNRKEKLVCSVINGDEQAPSILFTTLLKTHLKLAGLSVSDEKAPQEGGELTYIFSLLQKGNIAALLQTTREYSQNKVLLLLIEGQQQQSLPQEIREKCISSSEHQNYYFYFFSIIKTLFQDLNIDIIISNFEKVHDSIPCNHTQPPLPQSKKNQHPFFDHIKFIWCASKWLATITFFTTVSISMGLLSICWNVKSPEVLSELPIPTGSIFLERPALLQEIDKSFKRGGTIQTIALVGIGGSGKTTLARQYARQQKINVVWEINAETRESMGRSFEKLAYALSKTEEDQKILRRLLDIKESTRQKEEIIQFAKERLKSYKPWLLIFDNVENFMNIQKYFPQDMNTWGEGKILLTTRNTNIQNSNLVSHVVSIGELNQKEKVELFTKIMRPGIYHAKADVETTAFLENLPPFPLDISVAAYYLKSTNITYDQYIEKLKKHTKENNRLHENILKETGEYTKTRYAIITHSLEYLIKSHPDFAELLLFISLLDSQNIPKSLLDRYKNSSIVDNFIFHLKKHSLITGQTLFSTSEPLYSMHRSTQTIGLSYLTELLELNEESQVLKLMIELIDDYADKTIEQEDFPKMQIMARHLEKVLNHPHILTNFFKGLLESKLGSIYYFINNDKSKKLIDDSLKILQAKNLENLFSEDALRLARALLNIGAVYTELRLDKEAEEVFEKAIYIYRKEGSKKYADLSWALSHLGNVHRKLGNYNKARNYLEESIYLQNQYSMDKKRMARTLAHLGGTYRGLVGFHQKAIKSLEESLDLHTKYFPQEHFRMGWILTQLGNVYRDLGESKKAERYFEHSLLIFKNHLPEDHLSIGLTLAYLGNCYRKLSEYEKSRNCLEQSLKIHQKHFDENHARMGWILFHLAKTYKALEKHEKSQKVFDKVLKIYANNCGEDNIKTVSLLKDMAEIFIEKNRLGEAENCIKKTLKILQDHNHIDTYRCLEILGEIYLKKSTQSTYAKNNQEHQSLKNHALNAFNQAFKIIEQHFPRNSIHNKRIRSKIKNIQETRDKPQVIF